MAKIPTLQKGLRIDFFTILCRFCEKCKPKPKDPELLELGICFDCSIGKNSGFEQWSPGIGLDK